MSKSQRTKGACFEREVATILSDSLGSVVKRNLGQARDGGDDITINRLSGGQFRIECKRRSAISAEAWLRQVEAAAKPGDVPLVVARADFQEPFVMLRLADFLPLLGNEVRVRGA